MADKLTLDIVTPHGHVFTDEVDEIVAPGVRVNSAFYRTTSHFSQR